MDEKSKRGVDMPLFNINGEWVEASDEAAAYRVLQGEPEVQVPAEIQLAVKAAEAFPQGDISHLRTPGALTSMQEGFMSNSDPESLAFWENKYPDRDVRSIEQGGEQYVVSQNPDNYELEFANLPGADWGDVARGVGGAALPAATGAGIALSGGGLLPLMGGVAASELAMEGAQGLYGSQREEPETYLGRAALSGLLEAPGALLSTGGTMVANQALKRGVGAEADNARIMAMQAGEEAGLTPVDWKRYQFSQDPVAKRFMAQKAQYSPEMQALQGNQMNRVMEAAQDAVPFKGPEGAVDDIVGQQMKSRYAQGLVKPPEATAAGRNVERAAKEVLGSKKRKMNAEYNLLDRVAAEEEPVINIAKTIDLAGPREVMGEGVDGPVNAAAREAPNELAQIKVLLQNSAPLQENYEFVKQIRSRLGALQEMPRAKLMESGMDIGEIKRLRGQLTNDMTSNTGAPKFEKQARKASDTAKGYYDTYDINQIKNTINKGDSKQYNNLYKSLANNPSQMEKAFTDALDQSSPEAVGQLRSDLVRTIMSSDNPMGAIKKWREDSGDGYRWLTKDPAVRDSLDQAARLRKKMDSSKFKDAWEQDTMRSGFALEALSKEAVDARSSRALVKEMGGRGSQGHEALRTAIYENLIHRSTSLNPASKSDGLHPDLVWEELRKLKDTKQWSEILTKEDKEKLQGLHGYAETAWKRGSGSDGLSVSGTIGNILSADAPEAIAKITTARWIARIMMSKSINKNALRNAASRATSSATKQAFSGRWPRAAASVIANMGEPVETTVDAWVNGGSEEP